MIDGVCLGAAGPRRHTRLSEKQRTVCDAITRPASLVAWGSRPASRNRCLTLARPLRLYFLQFLLFLLLTLGRVGQGPVVFERLEHLIHDRRVPHDQSHLTTFIQFK